jgi:two-component sensor histidine kinase
MSLAHEKLYQSKDLANIDFHDYIKDLGNEMFGVYNINPGKVTLDIDVEHIYLEIDIAIPSGLVISELISNAMKHAFPNNLSGVVLISFHSLADDEVELIVSDTGIGFPEGLDFRECNSLGLKLVTNLIEKQLHGNIVCNKNKGTEFIIHFKKSKYMKRI